MSHIKPKIVPASSSTMSNPTPPVFLPHKNTMSIRWAVTQQPRVSVASDWFKGWACNSNQPLRDQLHDEIEGEKPQSRVQRARQWEYGGCSVHISNLQSPQSPSYSISSFISLLLQNPQISHFGGMRSATCSQMASNSFTLLLSSSPTS